MTELDKDTRQFFDKIADGEPEKAPKNPAAAAAAVGKAVRVAQNLTDAARAPRYVAKQLVGAAMKSLLEDAEKTASSHSALGLFATLNERYGRDWYDWEPETIQPMLRRDLSKEELSPEIRDAVGALQVLVKTNSPFEDWHIFEKAAHALNMNRVDFSALQPHELDELALAIRVMRKIRPKQEFDDEVCAYIAACAAEAGVVYLPPELFPAKANDTLQKALNDPYAHDLADSVRHAWQLGPKSFKPPVEEDLAVQLARLEEIKERAAHA